MKDNFGLYTTLDRLFGGDPASVLTLDEFLKGLEGRSYAFAIMALNMPNIVPSGIPWLSTVTGVPAAASQLAPGASAASAGHDHAHEEASLLIGSRWATPDAPGGRTVISYSFGIRGASYAPEEADFSATLAEFSEADKQTTRDVLHSIEAVRALLSALSSEAV